MTAAISRRSALASTSAVLAAAGSVWSQQPGSSDLQLASFRFDVTPPLGHSLCGGWIKPALAVEDPLEALGIIVLGAGAPLVLCAVDWTGILNAAHLQWRQALADAVGTTADRVAVHCVHQHNAPFACLDAQRLVAPHADLPSIVDPTFFQQVLERGGQAARQALDRPQPIDGVAWGKARVLQVASNRRILGPDGKVVSQRGSSSTVPEHAQLPEGVIDPWLRTVAFYRGDRKLAALHYYACHPMSYYGDGRVSADFCGLARRQRQQHEPDCLHVYFNGCGGNIGAGKYNDGSPRMRGVLRDRILAGIVASEADLRPVPLAAAQWRTQSVLPPWNPRFDPEALAQAIADPQRSTVERNRPAFTLGWIQRCARQEPIVLSSLHLNEQLTLLHLPAECFVEYQLRAQSMAAQTGKQFIAVAAYGDGGPWYIPTREAYPQGGYAVSVAFCDPQIDAILTRGIQQLL